MNKITTAVAIIGASLSIALAAPAVATPSEDRAYSKAQDYLDMTAFSATGLADQLEYEGFSTADAAQAVNRLTVDWNEQAAKKAADYLDMTSFSLSGLVEQLEYEGFTPAQAQYGASTAYNE
jgi:hypothetical protein